MRVQFNGCLVLCFDEDLGACWEQLVGKRNVRYVAVRLVSRGDVITVPTIW